MSSVFYSTLFSGESKSVLAPDPLLSSGWRPAYDFVMCRNAEGHPTAVYGQDRWDFNPIRLSVKKISVLDFGRALPEGDPKLERLKQEAKWMMFCLAYYVNTGRLGGLSVATLYRYFPIIMEMAKYCLRQEKNKVIGILTLQQVMTTPVYLAVFMGDANLGSARKKILRSLVMNLIGVGEERLGYRVQGSDLDFGRENNNQHPVIPSTIYLGAINSLGDIAAHVFRHLDNIERFVLCFTDRQFGKVANSKKRKAALRREAGDGKPKPTFAEAVSAHGLGDFFIGDFSCSGRIQLGTVLSKIQYAAKAILHCYTGMRDQEVMRLPYDCLRQAEVSPELVDSEGVVRDKAVIIDLISTTSKFTGYKAEASWLAASEVIKAVQIAQAVCRAICVLHDVKVDNVPLFISSAAVKYKKVEVNGANLENKYRFRSFLKATLITAQDLHELETTAPGRLFTAEEGYAVGLPWPLTSHQFRRSLAFYGSSSGFVSMPSLKRQFKHLTLQMSRYYANNFEKLKTIFGYYDSEKGEYVLPSNHMAFDYQTGMPISVAYDLLTEVLGSDARLYGGTGSYIEKQRNRLEKGQVLIADVRDETLKRVEQGHISFRKTLLGACMKSGPCDAHMLGNYISCLSCPGGLIKSDKLEQAINEAKEDLEVYQPDTGEYQVVKYDLDELVRYRHRHIMPEEII
ncbi:hypothetical protein [Pseudomonas synxantha]|uniref:hypothetical protein n=1 Tax=Pseudomonas synxantha TaxID=47883 RepID=UPI0006148472|nr:hypothetical protein [Pseudomonas synxantha]